MKRQMKEITITTSTIIWSILVSFTSIFRSSSQQFFYYAENLKCQWDLCKFETEDRTDFLRHLDFHAYHTRLKTFGLGLLRIITVPNCQTDSKFRNVIPDIDQDYFCYWNGCSQSFPIYKIYLEHVSDHIEKLKPDLFSELKYRKKITELKVKCQWDDCQTESSNVFTLKRHVKSHTNEKMIGCANCGVLFATKTFFINHCVRQDVTRKFDGKIWTYQDIHMLLFFLERNFQCPDCFRLYPTEKLLKEHTRGHVNKYQCQFCGLSWQKQSVLARHIRYRHLTEQPFGCDECEYKAKTKRDLESHQKVHKTGDLFKCEEFHCEYTSRTLQALKRHDAKVHLDRPPSYQCHCCDKVFEKGCLLSKHLIRDHGFQLAPGHSRFIYKQDFDGFYRLQTKRVENLKEIPQTVTAPPDDDAKIKTYEIENISISENLSTPINIKLKEIVRPTKMDTPTYSIFGDDSTQDSKDINDFAIVKNYKKIIKKRKLDATENWIL